MMFSQKRGFISFSIRPFGWLLLGYLIATAAESHAFQGEEQVLTQLADDKVSDYEKSLLFRELAAQGGERSIDALANLLSDAQLSYGARQALEPNPSPKVDAALCDSLASSKGEKLVGLLNSIANRANPDSIDIVAPFIQSENLAISMAAAHSLGRIGTPKSANILRESLTSSSADSALYCCKKLIDQGHRDMALQLLSTIRELPDLSASTRLASELHWIKLQGKAGLPALRNALASTDQGMFHVGLRTARLIDPALANEVVLEMLPEVSEDRLPVFIELLGDLGQASSTDEVVKAASSDNPDIKVAAMKALLPLGNASHIQLLIDAAEDSDTSVSSQAKQTLVSLETDGIDDSLLQMLKQGPSNVVVQMIGARRIQSAGPILLSMVDGSYQLEVILALGEITPLSQIDSIGSLLRSNDLEVRSAAKQAMHAACLRMPDRKAAVMAVASYLDDSNEEITGYVFDEVRQIGGDTALELVAEAAKHGEPLQREYSTRALGEWLDTTAAPHLIEIAETEGGSKFGVRALRGYIRLCRQFAMKDDDRLSMCKEAIRVATRSNEKELVLVVLERNPSLQSLKLAIAACSDESIEEAAYSSTLAIAKNVGSDNPRVIELLKQAGLSFAGISSP